MPALSSEKLTSLIPCPAQAGSHAEMKAVDQLISVGTRKRRQFSREDNSY